MNCYFGNSQTSLICCYQLLNPVWLFATPWTAPGFSFLHYLPEFVQILFFCLICFVFFSDSFPLNWWCHPTILLSVVPFSSCPQPLPTSGSFPLSQLFASGGQSIKSFSLSISPSNEYSGLISFKIDWFDLLAVQGTLKSVLQHHSLKAWILWCSAFFMVHLSYLYMTTRKTIICK